MTAVKRDHSVSQSGTEDIGCGLLFQSDFLARDSFDLVAVEFVVALTGVSPPEFGTDRFSDTRVGVDVRRIAFDFCDHPDLVSPYVDDVFALIVFGDSCSIHRIVFWGRSTLL